MGVRLSSECLLSKYGFQDGDVMFDFICRHNRSLLDIFGHDMSADHRVLIKAVRRYLLPRTKITTDDCVIITTSHNPIRIRCGREHMVTYPYVVVELSDSELQAILNELVIDVEPVSEEARRLTE